MQRKSPVSLFLLLIASTSCTGIIFGEPEKVPNRLRSAYQEDARIAVTWLGHATMLVQMDDRFILTDPLLENSAGQVARRLQEPGIAPENLPSLDLVVISHMHTDHLSLGSLKQIESKVRHLFMPRGGLVYLPNYRFAADELGTWESAEITGLRVTAVPIKHGGYRYGVDAAWMTESATGYVFEYNGLSVYFAGDTAYDQARFRQTAERFPRLDLAMLPIGPIRPRWFMESMHVDPAEALQAFVDLGARTMVPMHYETLVSGFDAKGEARETLAREARSRNLASRVIMLPVGGQAIIVPSLVQRTASSN
jgi:L-ascorbate metabolism protein UlaG (beta-lactamase superfamily)